MPSNKDQTNNKDEHTDLTTRINDLRSDMNFRFNIVFGLLIAVLGMLITIMFRL